MRALHELLRGWQGRGWRVLEGPEGLTFRGPGKEPPAEISETASLLREEILAVLRGEPLSTSWRTHVRSWPAGQRERWEERAAIREFDGGFCRDLAELLAFKEVSRALGGEGSEEVHP